MKRIAVLAGCVVVQPHAKPKANQDPPVRRDQKWISENGSWLVANKKADGVVSLPSGLQYKVIASGGGDQLPLPESEVSCSYEARLIDGTVFDTSDLRGDKSVSFRPKDVLPGFAEGVQMMAAGDEYELYLPYQLGFGAVNMDSVKPFSTVIYKVAAALQPSRENV